MALKPQPPRFDLFSLIASAILAGIVAVAMGIGFALAMPLILLKQAFDHLKNFKK